MRHEHAAGGAARSSSSSSTSSATRDSSTATASVVKLVGTRDRAAVRHQPPAARRSIQGNSQASGEMSAVDLPSDVKTIAYFIRSETSAQSYADNPQAAWRRGQHRRLWPRPDAGRDGPRRHYLCRNQRRHGRTSIPTPSFWPTKSSASASNTTTAQRTGPPLGFIDAGAAACHSRLAFDQADVWHERRRDRRPRRGKQRRHRPIFISSSACPPRRSSPRRRPKRRTPTAASSANRTKQQPTTPGTDAMTAANIAARPRA